MAYNFDINISVQKIQNEDFERLLDSLQNLQFFPFSVKIPPPKKRLIFQLQPEFGRQLKPTVQHTVNQSANK